MYKPRLGTGPADEEQSMIRGSCLCGGVSFEISGGLDRASHCHCTMCRKMHGAAFGSYVGVQRESFRWLSGEELVRGFASSPEVIRTFCSRCGSTLQYVHRGQPARFALALGVLDDDPGVRPALHMFVADKAPWFEITDLLPQYSGDA
jgi:hypothetical protein